MAYQGDNLKSTSLNRVKLYPIAGKIRSVATWLPQTKLKALCKNPDYLETVDLIQDLKFETATTKIKVTPDREYVIASGIYPQQIKVYELRELSLKFERHIVSEIINFQVLDDDYSKLAFLCHDRTVCLHAKYGSHYSLKIPRMGRDIAYDSWSCDIICAASSPDLYRINLEQGRFLSSLTTQSPALNVVCRSKVHGLVAGGGEDGAVECFDMRTKSSVGRINAAVDEEVTAIEFDGDGDYHMAVGSSGGKILIYDMRSSNPIRVEDHMHGSPVLNIKWHKTLNSEHTKLITSDKHIIRIWDPKTGEAMTSIEPTGGKINDICVFKDSGLILLALDNSQIPSYFIPALGPAPNWCSHLENFTEKLEEGGKEATIYENYKFLTMEDVTELNLTRFIGTDFLRAYMHGFYVDVSLYEKARSMAELSYEDYIAKRKNGRIITYDPSYLIKTKILYPYDTDDTDDDTDDTDDDADDADDADVHKPLDINKPTKKKKVVWNSESLAMEESFLLAERAALREPRENSRHFIKHGKGGCRKNYITPDGGCGRCGQGGRVRSRGRGNSRGRGRRGRR